MLEYKYKYKPEDLCGFSFTLFKVIQLRLIM